MITASSAPSRTGAGPCAPPPLAQPFPGGWGPIAGAGVHFLDPAIAVGVGEPLSYPNREDGEIWSGAHDPAYNPLEEFSVDVAPPLDRAGEEVEAAFDTGPHPGSWEAQSPTYDPPAWAGWGEAAAAGATWARARISRCSTPGSRAATRPGTARAT